MDGKGCGGGRSKHLCGLNVPVALLWGRAFKWKGREEGRVGGWKGAKVAWEGEISIPSETTCPQPTQMLLSTKLEDKSEERKHLPWPWCRGPCPPLVLGKTVLGRGMREGGVVIEVVILRRWCVGQTQGLSMPCSTCKATERKGVKGGNVPSAMVPCGGVKIWCLLVRLRGSTGAPQASSRTPCLGARPANHSYLLGHASKYPTV